MVAGRRRRRRLPRTCWWTPASPHAPRWRAPAAAQVGEAARAGYAPFFTVAPARQVAQAVFTFAWHLARCQGTAARLLLGHARAVRCELIAQRTSRQVLRPGGGTPGVAEAALARQPRGMARTAAAARHGDAARAASGRGCAARRLLAAEARHTASDGQRRPA